MPRSDPAQLPVGLKGPDQTLSERDLRRKTQIGAGAGDVEPPVAGEELDPAPEDRRLYPKGYADRLADDARHPDRPDGDPQPRGPDVGHVGNLEDQLVEGGGLVARQNVGLPDGRRGFSRQLDTPHQVP